MPNSSPFMRGLSCNESTLHSEGFKLKGQGRIGDFVWAIKALVVSENRS
jgi:hypothetical protein